MARPGEQTRGVRRPVLFALAAAVAWLPFVGAPPSPDEGGFLMTAGQWAPGSSLYGDYWVDRPPLLLALFWVADVAGGLTALRLLGIAAVVVSVLLAARIGRLVVPGSRGSYAAATAAVFLSTPLFGTTQVDGELLAVPLVMLGLVGVLTALRAGDDRAALRGWALAGAAGMAAPLVKQSMLDVAVVLAVVLAATALRGGRRTALRAAATAAAAALGVVAVAVLAAALRGTDPAALWHAVVTFRLDANQVLAAQDPAGPAGRARNLAVSFVVSAAPVVLLAFASTLRPRLRGGAPALLAAAARGDVRLLALVLLTWEIAAVAAGGSYWLHYLIGTVPGLVLATVAVVEHRGPRRRVLLAGLVSATVVGVLAIVAPAPDQAQVDADAAVAGFLEANKRPGDTGVVTFGHPNILYAAGLSSPYPQLWSLPVRVDDADLRQLTRVLRRPAQRPAWLVVAGASLQTWGVDADRAQRLVDRHYRPVRTFGPWTVWEVRERDEPPVPRGQLRPLISGSRGGPAAV